MLEKLAALSANGLMSVGALPAGAKPEKRLEASNRAATKVHRAAGWYHLETDLSTLEHASFQGCFETQSGPATQSIRSEWNCSTMVR